MLNDVEKKYIDSLKEMGVLKVLKKGDCENLTKNGGVAIFCGDGDIDARQYHCETISSRPHAITLFGGVLTFAQSFSGFNRAMFEGVIENINWGMEAKATRSIFLYPHYPCGVASKFKLSLQGTIELAAEAHEFFAENPSFLKENIHSLFHIKGINKEGWDVQATYFFYPELLK